MYKRKYGTGHLLIDVFLTLITGGLWLIIPILQFLNRNK